MLFPQNILIDAMIKFALLGTLGEIVAKLIKKDKITFEKTLYSAFVWAILGFIIKIMFVGFDGFVAGLIGHGYFPDNTFAKAFGKSFFTNMLFGPWIIIIHRFLDSMLEGKYTVPTQGLKASLLTLIWFWLPAHTITFALPDKGMQITLAAAWSFVLGLILGYFASPKKETAKK